jgi:hypothetical protein
MKLYRFGRQFLNLKFEDQLLMIEASALLIFLRISLRKIPANKLYGFLSPFLKKPIYSYSKHIDYTNKVIKAVLRSGHYLLKKKCLAQAMAVHILLLNKRRIYNNLYVGFIRHGEIIYGHAWVEADEKILIGDTKGLYYYFIVSLSTS